MLLQTKLCPPPQETKTMSFHQQTNPENFKRALQLAKKKKEKSLFAFDIDSTLFCMKYRTQAIIRDCSKDFSFQQKFPEQVQLIKKVEVTKRDWSVAEVMSRYGFSPEDSIVLDIEKRWRKLFFTNLYLNLDKPYQGCVQFVQQISQTGAHICYLTARRRKTMYEGTVESLKKWAFPLEKESQLIMKEDSKMEDSSYKIIHLKKLIQKYKTIAFFENEPVILNQVEQIIPQIHLFWMNSTHSRKEEPPKSAWPLQMNYVW